MQACSICGKPTTGAVVGDVVHSSCPACTIEALKSDGIDVPHELREQLKAEPKAERKSVPKPHKVR